MTKSKKTQPEDTGVEVPAEVAAMMAVNPVLAKAWIDLMSESARFMTERLRRDMDLQKEILACRNPAELMRLQSEFFQNAMVQYTEEATRYSKMVFEAISNISKDARFGHRREYDDIPL